MLDFNKPVYDEFGNIIAQLNTALRGSFMRLDSMDEASIMKLTDFIARLEKGKFHLNKTDYTEFKQATLGCDAKVLIKSMVISELAGYTPVEDKKE